MAELEILKALVLTTGHLSPFTRSDMAEATPGVCIEWDYGWWVWVPDPADYDDASKDYTCPPELRAALDLARANGCEWCRFDADGSAAEGLELFDDE